jgi:hypothetical protein
MSVHTVLIYLYIYLLSSLALGIFIGILIGQQLQKCACEKSGHEKLSG